MNRATEKQQWGSYMIPRSSTEVQRSPVPDTAQVPIRLQNYDNGDTSSESDEDTQPLAASSGCTYILGSYLPPGLDDSTNYPPLGSYLPPGLDDATTATVLGSYLPAGLDDTSSSRPQSPTRGSASSPISVSSSSSSCDSSRPPSPSAPPLPAGKIIIKLSRKPAPPMSPVNSPVPQRLQKSPVSVYVPSFEPKSLTPCSSFMPSFEPTSPSPYIPNVPSFKPISTSASSPYVPLYVLSRSPTPIEMTQDGMSPWRVPAFHPRSAVCSPPESVSMEDLVSSFSENINQPLFPRPTDTRGIHADLMGIFRDERRQTDLMLYDDDVDMCAAPTPNLPPGQGRWSPMEVATSIVSLRVKKSGFMGPGKVCQILSPMEVVLDVENKRICPSTVLCLPRDAFPMNNSATTPSTDNEPMEVDMYTCYPNVLQIKGPRLLQKSKYSPEVVISPKLKEYHFKHQTKGPSKQEKRKYLPDVDDIESDSQEYPAKRRRIDTCAEMKSPRKAQKRKYVAYEDDLQADVVEYCKRQKLSTCEVIGKCEAPLAPTPKPLSKPAVPKAAPTHHALACWLRKSREGRSQ